MTDYLSRVENQISLNLDDEEPFCADLRSLVDEVKELRAIRDRLIAWPTVPVNFKADMVLKGEFELRDALYELHTIIAAAQSHIAGRLGG